MGIQSGHFVLQTLAFNFDGRTVQPFHAQPSQKKFRRQRKAARWTLGFLVVCLGCLFFFGAGCIGTRTSSVVGHIWKRIFHSFLLLLKNFPLFVPLPGPFESAFVAIKGLCRCDGWFPLSPMGDLSRAPESRMKQGTNRWEGQTMGNHKQNRSKQTDFICSTLIVHKSCKQWKHQRFPLLSCILCIHRLFEKPASDLGCEEDQSSIKSRKKVVRCCRWTAMARWQGDATKNQFWYQWDPVSTWQHRNWVGHFESNIFFCLDAFHMEGEQGITRDNNG